MATHRIYTSHGAMDVTKALSTKMRDIDFLLISGPRGELSTYKLKSHSISSLTWLTSTAMPLRTVESVETSSLQTTPEQYLIFYSSINNGRLWCPVLGSGMGSRHPGDPWVVTCGSQPGWVVWVTGNEPPTTRTGTG